LIKITVWDNGLGISSKNQKKLFKLFGKIDNNQNMNKKGIGLGLYICKMIANQFEGDITVES
jgi:K+-sensing histidine kinase KdpD